METDVKELEYLRRLAEAAGVLHREDWDGEDFPVWARRVQYYNAWTKERGPVVFTFQFLRRYPGG